MANLNETQVPKETLGSKDYIDSFDAEQYLQTYYPTDSPINRIKAMIEQLHHFFKTALYERNAVKISRETSRRRIAGFGSGPALHEAISASKFYKQIYLTDNAPSSLDSLRKWMARDITAFDRTKYFQLVSNHEGNGIITSDIETRVRESIKGILPCDLTAREPLGPNRGNTPMADAIISSLTIEVVAKDEQMYLDCLKKFYDLLAPGGLLCLFGDQQSGVYRVGNTKFVTKGNSPSMVESKLLEAGFCNIPVINLSKVPDFYFASAFKKINEN